AAMSVFTVGRSSQITLPNIVRGARPNDPAEPHIDEGACEGAFGRHRLGQGTWTAVLVLRGYILRLDQLGSRGFVIAVEMGVRAFHEPRFDNNGIDPIPEDRLDDAAPLSKSRSDVRDFGKALRRDAHPFHVGHEILSILGHIRTTAA